MPKNNQPIFHKEKSNSEPKSKPFLSQSSEYHFPPLDHRVHNMNNRIFQDEILTKMFIAIGNKLHV